MEINHCTCDGKFNASMCISDYDNGSERKFNSIFIERKKIFEFSRPTEINSENFCYYSLCKLLSSLLLFKTPKIRIYKALPVVLYGCVS